MLMTTAYDPIAHAVEEFYVVYMTAARAYEIAEGWEQPRNATVSRYILGGENANGTALLCARKSDALRLGREQAIARIKAAKWQFGLGKDEPGVITD